jgi:hypothetical protein
MPPARKKTKDRRPNYGWTTGRMKGITHQGLIAAGGFGEVHKVLKLDFFANIPL